MDVKVFNSIVFIISNCLQCVFATVSLQEQLDHVADRILESRLGRRSLKPNSGRRSGFQFDLHSVDGIIGAPSMPSHLPEAEPILPGHTLIRPAIGMLKSSVKFPHREMENGFGVDGNINNLGIRWDGKNERVLYSGFRRSPSDYIMVVPKKPRFGSYKPSFDISTLVLDMDKKQRARDRVLDKIRSLRLPSKKKWFVFLVDFEDNLRRPKKAESVITNKIISMLE